MPTSEPCDVVLPAGGRITGEFAQMAETEIKALIPFDGETILRRTIRALRDSGCIRRIAVIGPEEVQAEARASGADLMLPEGATGPENIFKGLDGLAQTTPHLLIVTGDMPFLTPEAVRDFLALCPEEGEICIPIVERSTFEVRFPDLIRTDTPLHDGNFRLGGIFRVEAATLRRTRPHLEQMFAARKNNLQMARLIGVPFIVRYLFRRLTVDQIVARAGQILQCRGAAVRPVAPELAFDIDLPEELAYARQFAEANRAPVVGEG
jgi:GTP:adenosylcobinamide-phosphate guanylyltransferase